MSDLTDQTLAEARDGLRARRFSSQELTQAHLDAMAGARSLNAFITETPEQALAMAKASDARLGQGAGGPLEGVPLGIKDLLLHQGRSNHGWQQHPRQFRSPLQVDHHKPALARWCRHAR